MYSFTNFKNKNKFDEFKSQTDGRFHYVYRITDLVNGIHYIGSRTTSETPMNDLVSYGTSSYRKNEILSNPESFKFKILRVFDNPQDKTLYESYLHFKFDVKNHEKFWNKSNQTPNGFDTTGLSFKHSKEHILKRTEKRQLVMLEVDETGLNKFQKAARLANKTKNKKDETGMTGYQKIANKAWQTKKANGFEFDVDNNPKINIIYIFNDKEEVVYEIRTGFMKFCKDNKLPVNALRKSYLSKGKKLYIDLDAGNLKKMKDTNEYKTYKGWCAIKSEDLFGDE